MAKKFGKKFAWVIKDFSSLQADKCYSVPFLIGDNKWRLCVYPKGNKVDGHLSLYLEVVDSESLPSGWRRYVNFRLTIVKQIQEEYPVRKESHCWFDKKSWKWGFSSISPLDIFHDKEKGFLMNGELVIIAEVLDASEKSKESSSPRKKIKLNDDCAEFNESVDVNGFQVLPSQVEFVRRIFERHPDIAVNFRAKNQHLRTTCMNFLLSLIETLCQSLQELSNEDLADADIAVTYLKDVRFKVDWLEKKLKQVKENKEKEQFALAQLQETEEILLKLKQKFSEQKAELSATRTLLSFDDVV